MNMISLFNGMSVAIFGTILSASFCNIHWTGKKIGMLSGGIAGLLFLQGMIIYFMEIEMVRLLYPFITHLPLVIILYLFTKQKLWSAGSVLTAYLCCQLRRWLALLVTEIFQGNIQVQEIAEFIITVPLLLLLLKYIAPAIRSVSGSTSWVQWQFCLIPAMYYIFDYITKIYTDLLVSGNPVVAEFMSFVCSAAYLLFTLRLSEEKWVRSQLELSQESLNLQISQAVREIKTLRESQQKTKEHRHDLRHHMQYLASCIENGHLEHAKEYIQGICSEIETNKVVRYCENEEANLILSAFEGRAKEYHISMKIKAQIPKNIHVSESDLCVLLSNALENAVNACKNLEKKNIDVLAFKKNQKLCLQIKNTCNDNIVFVQGIPVNNAAGHGIGVRSMCALVERYGGIYTFAVEDGEFILRISM